MSKEVIIIGAGPGGLATSLLLAREGIKVRILESGSRVGGRTSAIEGDGYRFDVGPTFFLYPQVLQAIFQAVGRDLFKEIPMVRLDPQYRLIFGAGGEINATPDLEKMVAEIARLAPDDAPNFRRFMADNRVKLEKFIPCLQSPFLSWKDLFQPRILGVLPFLKPWKSLHEELSGYFRDPRLQLAFTFQSKYLGMSPFQCPSMFSILSFLEYEEGVWHPIGGCSALSEGMARVATELGVSIELDTPVEEILFEGRKATGVRTSQGQTHSADALVVNADFAHAMTKLVPNHRRRRWTNEKIARKKFSCSTFMLYLGVEGTYPELAHHNIYIAKDYQRNLREIEQTHTLSEDPSFYIQNASVTDPTLAPPGHSTLYVLIPVSHQHENIDWNVEKEKYRQTAFRQLAKIGLHDVESKIRFERMITPDDWATHRGVYRGATFNLAHTLGQMLHLRPKNRFDEFDGVYLVGGGTHPGSGLPVIFESARISSKLLVEDFAAC